MDINIVNASALIQLRRDILRPGQPLARCHFPFDEHGKALHLAAMREGQVYGGITALPQDQDELFAEHEARIRGMAVAAHLQGQGIGSQLLRQCIEQLRIRGCRSVWCNARSSATAFYKKFGFQVLGDEFEIPDVGMHYRYQLSLNG